MERFHYCFAVDFIGPLLDHQFIHGGLDRAAGTFVRNMFRVQALGRLPILLVGGAIVTQTYDMMARQRLGFQADDPQLTPGGPKFNEAGYMEKEMLRKQMQKEWFQMTQKGEATSGMAIGEDALARMIPAGGSETEEGIEAILIAMVTGLWTAFEVMAEEIWNASIVERPLLNASITDKERKATGFRSMKKLRCLYGYTFRTDEGQIFTVLNDDRIDALALTRNLIVHTGGVVDEEFDNRRANIPALACFAKVGRGQKITLTGPVVRDLLNPITSLGLELALAVDMWIVDHP